LDSRIKTLADTPHTISYVIRKRQQIDSLSELPKEKQPDLETIWDKSPEALDEWITRVFNPKEKLTTLIDIKDDMVEG
jgi:hypothetical protein